MGEKIGCSGDLFAGSLEPDTASLAGWLRLVTSYPRHPALLSDKNSGWLCYYLYSHHEKVAKTRSYR